MASVWRFRDRQIGRYFLLFLVCLQIWSLGFALEITATTLKGKLFWADIQFFGITLLPFYMLQVTLLLIGQAAKARLYMKVFGMLVALSNIFIWTNDFHHLFRAAPSVDCASAPFCILVSNYGPLFYFHAGVGYTMFLLSIVAAIRSVIVRKPIYRQQVMLLFASILFPLLTDMLYVAGITPIENFNFTPITFSVFSGVMAVAVFRYRLFNIRPLAYDRIVENMSDGIIITDNTHTIVDINPAAQRLLNVDGGRIIGEAIETLRDAFPGVIEHYMKGTGDHALIGITREHQRLYLEVGVSPIADKPRTSIGYTLSLRDVTERVNLQKEIRRLAATDPLTGLFNRRRFFELSEPEYSRAIRHNIPLSIALLDIDHFKSVNDTYGHAMGDRLLEKIAHCLQDLLRKEDIVARYGGEEFIFLFPQTDSLSARQIAERIREQVSNLVISENSAVIRVTASIGIASLDGEQIGSLGDLIHQADKALYQAKACGRNRVEQFVKSA